MLNLSRSDSNPILLPSLTNPFEKVGAFNPSIVKTQDGYVMLYRALSEKTVIMNNRLNLSTVALAKSEDGKTFTDERLFIAPDSRFDIYGCEDPRVTYMEGTYYIFYTGLSGYPFSKENIKVAVATTKDFKTIEEKHLVTPFNAKAMALFPEKINDKYAVILAANTDMPPAKIGIATFDSIDEFYSKDFWNKWYKYIDDHILQLRRNEQDQVEVGAQPIKTKQGWLLIYSHIRNYFSNNKIFGIEAALLDNNDPTKIIARTKGPLLTPKEDYEKFGLIPNVVFPSGALLENETLSVYYGGADTCCCVATCNINELLDELEPQTSQNKNNTKSYFIRSDENPILSPIQEHAWENKAVFNPAAVYENGKMHLLYRAMGNDNTSVIGYASSADGLHIDQRLPFPVYIPRESFEQKTITNANSGCEDPRISKIDNKYYMLYTAYDGKQPPRVALTSINVGDFLQEHWNWTKPVLISPPGVDDKDACIFPKRINNKYVFLHRMDKEIWIDEKDDLNFTNTFLRGEPILKPRPEKWDSIKVGISGPPIQTEKGWLLLYHGFGKDNVYKIGACLLQSDNPKNVMARLDEPIFEPEMEYEQIGQVPNVVFPCGSVIINERLLIYYGGADTVVGVASMSLENLLHKLAV